MVTHVRDDTSLRPPSSRNQCQTWWLRLKILAPGRCPLTREPYASPAAARWRWPARCSRRSPAVRGPYESAGWRRTAGCRERRPVRTESRSTSAAHPIATLLPQGFLAEAVEAERLGSVVGQRQTHADPGDDQGEEGQTLGRRISERPVQSEQTQRHQHE